MNVLATLIVTALVVAILVGVIWKLEARAKAERESNALKLSDLGQSLVRFDNELGAVAREHYELNARFEDHVMSPHPKPPVRKAAANKAPAKKAAPKKATPAKKAPRQRSVS